MKIMKFLGVFCVLFADQIFTTGISLNLPLHTHVSSTLLQVSRNDPSDQIIWFLALVYPRILVPL